MQLLESSPFLASIFMTYANGGGISNPASENEELATLRASYESLRAEHESLKTDHKIAQAEARAAQYAYEAEINKLKSVQRAPTGQPVSNGSQSCGRCAELRAELDSNSEALRAARQENEHIKVSFVLKLERVLTLLEITHEATLSHLRHEKTVSERQAMETIQSSRAEVENLKVCAQPILLREQRFILGIRLNVPF